MGTGELGRITLHHNPGVRWQKRAVMQFVLGLSRLGYSVIPTESRQRVSPDPAILLGTTFFHRVESEPGDWLLVDRASYGDPDFVQLVWNGHGRRGDHRVPQGYGAGRFVSHGVKLHPFKTGSRVLLCGQDRAYSEDWDLHEWYAAREYSCSHFKPHPAVPVSPSKLPVVNSFEDCGLAVTLNSSVAVECLKNGIEVEVDDSGGMAYQYQDRQQLFEWLAWTQWTWEEIGEGEPIRHIFDGK